MSAAAAATAPSADVASVLRALAAVHAPDTPQQQRAEAQRYTEHIKSQPQQCLAVSLSLLQLPASSFGADEASLAPAARHFALHALVHLIATGWTALAEGEKEYLKNQAIGIVQNRASLCGDVRYLKQTVARIVTEIALREWPQRWPNMLDVLFAACSGSGAQPGTTDPSGTELLALILRNLSEEATNSDVAASSGASALPERRRRDVQAGLMTCMPQAIYPWLLGALKFSVAAFSADKSNAQALRNCRALIEALYAMLDFLPAKLVFEPSAPSAGTQGQLLLSDLCSYLAQPDLFESLCDLLSSVCGRKAHTLEDSYGGQLVAVWDAGLNWMQVLLGANTRALPRKDAFIQKLLSVLSNLTRQHSELLLPASLDPLKLKLLQVLGALLAHESAPKDVSYVALELWLHLFRHHPGSIIKQEYRQGLLGELLKIASLKLVKGAPAAAAAAEDDEEEEGVESAEERNQFFGVYRGAMLQLVGAMSEMQPLLCFQAAVSRFDALLSAGAPAPRDHLKPGPEGWVSMRTARFLELEAAGSMLEHVLRHSIDAPPMHAGVKQAQAAAAIVSSSATPEMRQLGERLLSLLLSWRTDDPLLQTRRLHALGMCAPSLASHSGALVDALLEALLAGVCFRPQLIAADVPWSALSEDLRACRRRAIVSLIQLARRKELVRDFLLARFSGLLQRILSMVQARLIASAEKIALYEFLVLIALELPSAAEQQVFLQSILAEPLAQWTAPDMQALLAFGPQETPANAPPPFLQLLGLNSEEQALLADAERLPLKHATAWRDKRKVIAQALHTFMAVFKPLFIVSHAATGPGASAPSAAAASEATQQAAMSLVPMLLPNVLRLLGHLYSLRSDATRAMLPAHMLGLLSPSAEVLLHPSAPSLSTQPPSSPTHWHLTWLVRVWIDKALDVALHVLMLCAKSGAAFFAALADPGLAAQFERCVYVSLPHAHLRDLRTFLDKFIESVLVRCPPERYAAVLLGQFGAAPPRNTLANVIAIMQQRIEQGWAKASAAAPANKPNAALGAPPSAPAVAAASSASSSLAAEILEDNELRELSRAVSEVLSRAIEAQYVPALAAAQAQISANAPVLAKDKDRHRVDELSVLRGVPFVQLILRNEPVQRALFELLIGLTGCPDSAASVRAVRLLQRLYPALLAASDSASSEQQPSAGLVATAASPLRPLSVSLYARVFEQGVRVLATAKAQLLDVVEGELIPLLKDLYVALVLTEQLSPAPRAMLQSLTPGAAAELPTLEESLRAVAAEKKHRSAMRVFFERHVKATRLAMQQQRQGAQLMAANPLDLLGQPGSSSTVRDLEPLNLPRKPKSSGGDDEVPELFNLFD